MTCSTCLLSSGFNRSIWKLSLILSCEKVLAKSIILKLEASQLSRQCLEQLRCLKTCEFLSRKRCSLTRVWKCLLVSRTRKYDYRTWKYTQVAEMFQTGWLCFIVSFKSLLHREMTLFRAQNCKDIEVARICNTY